MKAAAAILTQAFVDSTKGFATVASLRQVASRVAPYTPALILPDSKNLAHMFLNEGGLRSAFGENANLAIDALGGIDGITQSFVDEQLSAYEATIDGASLILAHSVLDSAVFQFCRATATARPADWESLVEGRKIPLSSLKGRSYEDLLSEKVAEFIKDFERESLLKKVDRIFAICSPKTTSSKKYVYSRERLERLDNLRHSMVHGRSAFSRLPAISDDIDFLRTTNFFLYSLVMDRYQLALDTDVIVRQSQVESGTRHNPADQADS